MINTQHDKALLHHCILLALEANYQIALNAAQQAYETATNTETKAESKYDTFGLEASYLAHGQSKRVEECRAHIKCFKALPITLFDTLDEVTMGQLILLEGDLNSQQYYFMSPVAGGLKINFKNHDIVLITPNAPLGKALLNTMVDDVIQLDNVMQQCQTLKAIY